MNDTCLFSKSFIDSGILYVHDILADDGDILPELYGRIQNKRFYIQTLSMIQKALKPYYIIRYMDENIENENDPEFDITNKRCKWFYERMAQS